MCSRMWPSHIQHHSQTEAEPRIIIPHIVEHALVELQTIITLPLVPLLILHRQSHGKNRTHDTAEDHKGERDAISDEVTRSVVPIEDVTRDDTADVSESDL